MDITRRLRRLRRPPNQLLPAAEPPDPARIPAATLDMIIRYFGTGAAPDYSKTLGVLDRDPYRPAGERLATTWTVSDITDPNCDLSVVYALQQGPDRVTVQLSLVGPYAVILDQMVAPTDRPDIADVLAAEGFRVLLRHQLELPVRIWEPEVEGVLYEFLFTFDADLPWAAAGEFPR